MSQLANANLIYVKGSKILIKDNPLFDEFWVRDLIANDPSILGLGELILKDKERMQPKAGRLDLLFEDADNNKRYEVELMLGKIDESHIIRAIEYWDIEQNRYRDYDHCAVIVAEDITSRFLNVISLLNGAIPIIALQLNAIQIGNTLTLNFTKVLDEASLGTDEEDNEKGEPVDRSYWEDKSSLTSMKLVDQCYEILKEIDQNLTLKYNVYYIGLTQNNRANNFVAFIPMRRFLRVHIRSSDLEVLKSKFNNSNIDVLGIDRQRAVLRLNIDEGMFEGNREVIKSVFADAYREYVR
ncbi:conserved hypothetical protein [Methanocella paludicola SANAE]|uniref:DUF5655 domain-containing protein n=1 Tax=Methanocella paludicola (strain DSM 17711 / JCM 13418 / NBRC 101707 / SANAE) TaxID=304371 RepID=D1YX69_METPS|nr:hypothetical protein [Methanocella paludicola]BAI61041.1 conserved hypothetical protein [Methanocella paludicola SANAE]